MTEKTAAVKDLTRYTSRQHRKRSERMQVESSTSHRGREWSLAKINKGSSETAADETQASLYLDGPLYRDDRRHYSGGALVD